MISFIEVLNSNPSVTAVIYHAIDVIVPLIGIWLGYAYGKSKTK